MEIEIKIVFGIPKHVESELDGIILLYPYQIFSTEQFQQNSPIINHVKLIIPGRLIDNLDFQIWKPLENKNLMKLFLPFVIEEIKKGIKNKRVNNSFELVVPTSYNHNYNFQSIDSLPEVEGYCINVTIRKQ